MELDFTPVRSPFLPMGPARPAEIMQPALPHRQAPHKGWTTGGKGWGQSASPHQALREVGNGAFPSRGRRLPSSPRTGDQLSETLHVHEPEDVRIAGVTSCDAGFQKMQRGSTVAKTLGVGNVSQAGRREILGLARDRVDCLSLDVF